MRMHIRARIFTPAYNQTFFSDHLPSLSPVFSLYTTHAPPHSTPPATRVFAPLLSQPPFLSTLKTLQLAQSPLSNPTPCSHFPNPSPQSKLRFSKFQLLSLYLYNSHTYLQPQYPSSIVHGEDQTWQERRGLLHHQRHQQNRQT